jgi:lipoprotein NlpD
MTEKINSQWLPLLRTCPCKPEEKNLDELTNLSFTQPRDLFFHVTTRSTMVVLLVVLIMLLSACTGNSYAPVVVMGGGKRVDESETNARRVASVPARYLIQSGDTLYSIAWRYGLDYKNLASWNSIHSPYLIRAGEYLSLKPSQKARKVASPERQRPVAKSRDVEKKATLIGRSEPGINSGPLKWQWPTQGKLVHNTTPFGKKGVEIYGEAEQSIRAAAAGEVVYSGGGLVGYGKLIIIKHSEIYLSAYGHNSKLLVKEGDRVVSGQKIATMGKTGTNRIKLHFEIRENGEPVAPEKVLPRMSMLKTEVADS